MLRYSVASVRGHPEAGLRLYLEKGRQIAETVLALGELVDLAGDDPAGDEQRGASRGLLDFASGYGRSTRFLLASLPPSAITVSDVQLGGLAFQAATFGVGTLPSAADPADFQPARRWALVFAASFFTHVPPPRFGPWLERLAGLCDDDGVLAFSTLAETAAEGEAPVRFDGHSESAVLAPEDYGTTWVRDDFVASALAGVRTDGDRLEVVRRGLCAHQDLWVLRRGRSARRPLDLPRHPAGEVDRLDLAAERVAVEGWVEDLGEPPLGIAEVTLRAAGGPPRGVVPEGDGGRRRWRFTLDRDRVGLDDLIEIEARTVRGASNLLAVGTLRPFAG